jgi:hypothetical protein
VEWDRAAVIGRLDYLRRTDPGLTRFGSAAHRYLLNAPLSEQDVTAFEVRHSVSLPDDYRAFLKEVGDGGAGPFYGVFRLDRSDLPIRDREDLLPGFLAGAFPHERPWSEPGGGIPEAEGDYFDPAKIRGSLNLSHQGCGYMVRLVLNGPQRGALWEDGRCGDMGITPFRPDFATWYLQWLRDPKPK